MSYRLQTPDGQIKIKIAEISYVDLGQAQTVFRARTRLAKREYDIGGETEDKAFFNLLSFLSEKQLAAFTVPMRLRSPLW